jgi:hypothetical protein
VEEGAERVKGETEEVEEVEEVERWKSERGKWKGESEKWPKRAGQV